MNFDVLFSWNYFNTNFDFFFLRWVDKKATILTDFTIDRSVLEELGFHQVVQKNLNQATQFDRLTNRGIMDYLRRTVPKVFQNTLSLLSTSTIQQFLDELVWREIHGKSSSDAFHNMINDLSVQARADTGVSLVKMLHGVALNPFKDWKISQYKPSPAPINETPANPPVTIPAPLKRPAPPPEDNSESNAKEMRPSSYYSTMYDKTKPPLVSSPQDAIVTCQVRSLDKLDGVFKICFNKYFDGSACRMSANLENQH